MKLELKHLAPYLPYGLKVKIIDQIRNYKINQIRELKIQLFWDFTRTERNIIKPILRPLSDLTKEIQHNGEKFVPILELRCIEQGNWDGDEFILDHTQIIDYGVRKGDNNCYWVEWKDGLSQTQSFSFKDRDFSRFWITDRNKFGGISYCILNNRYLLFQKLFEWHFDVFGLLENNLAIDINTL
jgi:hypothetical protein